MFTIIILLSTEKKFMTKQLIQIQSNMKKLENEKQVNIIIQDAYFTMNLSRIIIDY